MGVRAWSVRSQTYSSSEGLSIQVRLMQSLSSGMFSPEELVLISELCAQGWGRDAVLAALLFSSWDASLAANMLLDVGCVARQDGAPRGQPASPGDAGSDVEPVKEPEPPAGSPECPHLWDRFLERLAGAGLTRTESARLYFEEKKALAAHRVSDPTVADAQQEVYSEEKKALAAHRASWWMRSRPHIGSRTRQWWMRSRRPPSRRCMAGLSRRRSRSRARRLRTPGIAFNIALLDTGSAAPRWRSCTRRRRRRSRRSGRQAAAAQRAHHYRSPRRDHHTIRNTRKKHRD